jgi:hypothetical protein
MSAILIGHFATTDQRHAANFRRSDLMLVTDRCVGRALRPSA